MPKIVTTKAKPWGSPLSLSLCLPRALCLTRSISRCQLQAKNKALGDELQRKREEHDEAQAEQAKKLAAMRLDYEQVKIETGPAAENLQSIKTQHASNGEYITSTEAAIETIVQELDSDDFAALEKELADLQASKTLSLSQPACPPAC